MTDIVYDILFPTTCTHSKVREQSSCSGFSPNHSSRGVAESHEPSSLTVPHSWDPVSPGTIKKIKDIMHNVKMMYILNTYKDRR